MTHFLQSPEFWTSLAFLIVVGVMTKPVMRFLNRWGQKKAEQIQADQQTARDLLEKAKALKNRYEAAYRNRQAEREKLLAEADQEIMVLEADTLCHLKEHMAHKAQEVALRLKMIEENGRQDIKGKMLARVLSDCRSRLETLRDDGQTDTDVSELLDRACRALDAYQTALKK